MWKLDDSLVYILDKSSIYSACFRPKGVKTYESFSMLQKNRLSRLVFRFLYSHSNNKEVFYNPELKNCEDKTVIAFDTVNVDLISWIRRNNPKNRIIVYFINTVRNTELPLKFKELRCELWSFDKDDCEKYNMNFNDWYCCYVADQNRKIKYDVSFVGREKTRRPFLDSFAEYMKKSGIKFYYHITHERNYPIINPVKYKHHIPYSKMVEIEKKSKAIVELVEPGQGGSTLRIMDCAFNNVKLITNFEKIKSSDLYNPNNIFVVKGTDFTGIKEFLEAPFEPYSAKIMKKYSFEYWIEQFRI